MQQNGPDASGHRRLENSLCYIALWSLLSGEEGVSGSRGVSTQACYFVSVAVMNKIVSRRERLGKGWTTVWAGQGIIMYFREKLDEMIT